MKNVKVIPGGKFKETYWPELNREDKMSLDMEAYAETLLTEEDKEEMKLNNKIDRLFFYCTSIDDIKCLADAVAISNTTKHITNFNFDNLISEIEKNLKSECIEMTPIDYLNNVFNNSQYIVITFFNTDSNILDDWFWFDEDANFVIEHKEDYCNIDDLIK